MSWISQLNDIIKKEGLNNEVYSNIGILTSENDEKIKGKMVFDEDSDLKIVIPGKLFNEIPSMGSRFTIDKPGKGTTIRGNSGCMSVFDIQQRVDEADFFKRCVNKDVLIVSHNKKIQQLIGDMFPAFKANIGSSCPYGIANCSVIEISKGNGVGYGIDDAGSYKLKVLADGFPDKPSCKAGLDAVDVNGIDMGLSGGVVSKYHYLTEKDNGAFVSDASKDSLLLRMFSEGQARKIIMIRHGNGPHNKPYGNIKFVNPPLTSLGVYQAYLVGKEIKEKYKREKNKREKNGDVDDGDVGSVIDFDNVAIFTSQLKRAQQTALQFLVSVLQDRDEREDRRIRINDFREKCKECLKHFNANLKQLLRGYKLKILLDKSRFFENKNHSKDEFIQFVKDNDLSYSAYVGGTKKYKNTRNRKEKKTKVNTKRDTKVKTKRKTIKRRKNMIRRTKQGNGKKKEK